MVFWNEYDIANAIIGGLLIGAATTFHFLFKGRITGFSGIYYSLVTMEQQSFLWKLTLMASIVVVSCGLFKAYGLLISQILFLVSGILLSFQVLHLCLIMLQLCSNMMEYSVFQLLASSLDLELSSQMAAQVAMVR